MSGRRAEPDDPSGGGPQHKSAVRIRLCPRSNRCQIRCQLRPLRRPGADRIAAARLPITAWRRNAQSVAVVRLERRILLASQMLNVRPHPVRRPRLLQKIRRARRVLCCGLPSSNPWSEPCRLSVPTVLQCGHGICLSRSQIVPHSCSLRVKSRCSLTVGSARERRCRWYASSKGAGSWRGPINIWIRKRRGRPEGTARKTGTDNCRIPTAYLIPDSNANSATFAPIMRPESGKGHIIYYKGQRMGAARLLDAVANGLARRKEQA